MKIKGVLAAVLVLCMIVCMMPLSTQAATVDIGVCGANMTWQLDSAGVLTIEGSGYMDHYWNEDQQAPSPWYDHREQIKQLNIENGVLSIGVDAFAGLVNLREVTIPGNVESVHGYAFSECWNLRRVVVEDGVQRISGNAFGGCTQLTEIILPKKMEDLGEISGLDSLTNIVLPETEEPFFSYFLAWSPSLVAVTIPKTVTELRDGFFENCDKLRHVLYTGTEEQWNAISVGADNEALDNAVIHFNAEGNEIKTEIHCSYTMVTCTLCNETVFVSAGGGHNYEDGRCTYCQVEDCWTYETNETGANITWYEGNDVDVVVPDAIEGLPVLGICGATFNNSQGTHALNSIQLPKLLERIGEYSFFMSPAVTDLVLPETVEYIGDAAFMLCPNMTSLTVTGHVKSLGASAFSCCFLLSRIRFEGDAPVISDYAFDGVTATAYYPADNPTWTEDVMQNYGGTITWVPYEPTSDEPVQGITVSGSLTSFQGENLTVELWLEGAQAASYSAVITDSSYCFENVPQGNYVLKISMDHGVTREYPLTAGDQELALDVKISPMGDVTGDGRINLGDVARVYSHIRGTSSVSDEYALSCADTNGDTRINLGDVAKIYSHIRGTGSLW